MKPTGKASLHTPEIRIRRFCLTNYHQIATYKGKPDRRRKSRRLRIRRSCIRAAKRKPLKKTPPRPMRWFWKQSTVTRRTWPARYCWQLFVTDSELRLIRFYCPASSTALENNKDVKPTSILNLIAANLLLFRRSRDSDPLLSFGKRSENNTDYDHNSSNLFSLALPSETTNNANNNPADQTKGRKVVPG